MKTELESINAQDLSYSDYAIGVVNAANILLIMHLESELKKWGIPP